MQALNDSYSTTAPGGVEVWPPGVLVNDRGVSVAPLTAELVSGPANGTLEFAADGSFSYTPNAGFIGTDTFRYPGDQRRVLGDRDGFDRRSRGHTAELLRPARTDVVRRHRGRLLRGQRQRDSDQRPCHRLEPAPGEPFGFERDAHVQPVGRYYRSSTARTGPAGSPFAGHWKPLNAALDGLTYRPLAHSSSKRLDGAFRHRPRRRRRPAARSGSPSRRSTTRW